MSRMNTFLSIGVMATLIGTAVFCKASPTSPKPLPNDQQFVDQIQKPGTVLVKFGAKWCPPCRKIEGELDHLAATYADQVSVVRIDIDQSRALAVHYGVHEIPHLILFQNGKQVDVAKGFRTRDQLRAWITAKR